MNLIVAFQKKDRAIGKNNEIPWRLSEDLIYFKNQTTAKNCDININKNIKNIVVMGRKTWESIPISYRPLKNRINYIISRNKDSKFKSQIESYDNTFLIDNLESIYKLSVKQDNNIWIIGGQSIYNTVLNNGWINHIYTTEIYTDRGQEYIDNSVFFNNIDESDYEITDVSDIKKSICKKTSKELYYRFVKYTNKQYKDKHHVNIWNSNENQYLNTLQEILDSGIETNDRTGVGTLSIFGKRFEYNLEKGLPVLTTKRVFLRAVFEELILYIKGETNNNILREKGINIWNGNTSRQFLDSRGLFDYPEGDMGETYGYNFRNYGGLYENCNVGISKQDGFDQLNYVINLIKNEPNSRRIIINLWNPRTLHKAALPSCLCQYQFYVDTKNNKLNLQIYIRSSDFFLANNWNTCTGAFLVHMICNLDGINLNF